jgi:predicted metal-dependent hydrolase
MDQPQPRTPRLRGADVGIPPRQVDFRLSEALPRRLVADNMTATMFLVMLSGMFPPGEAFFVRSVNRFRERVTEPRLRAQVAGFTAQETIHSREHDRLNDFLRARDIDVDLPERAVEVGLAVLGRLPARHQLVCTAMLEHFTAVLAEELLREGSIRDDIHPDLADLWLWHALEELEHKSVTYRVYQLIGERRAERLLALALVLATIAPAAIISWARLLLRERVWRQPRDVVEGLRLLLGQGGFLRVVLARMPQFGRRRFHPDHHDTSALEAHWRARLFGPEGTLRERLRHRAS